LFGNERVSRDRPCAGKVAAAGSLAPKIRDGQPWILDVTGIGAHHLLVHRRVISAPGARSIIAAHARIARAIARGALHASARRRQNSGMSSSSASAPLRQQVADEPPGRAKRPYGVADSSNFFRLAAASRVCLPKPSRMRGDISLPMSVLGEISMM